MAVRLRKMRIPKEATQASSDKNAKVENVEASVQTKKIIRKLKYGLRSLRESRRAGYGPGGRDSMFFFDRERIPSTPIVTEKIIVKEAPGIEMEISKAPAPLTTPLSSEEKEMLRSINISYPLIPEAPQRNERVYAYARIRWDNEQNELVYSVVEPQISDREREIIEFVKKELEERLDIDFMKLGEIRAKELLTEEIKSIILRIRGMDPGKSDVIRYYVQRDIIGLGRIEPLMRDKNIEEVSCDGEKIPLYIYHRNPLFGSTVTNTVFDDADDLDTFVMKMSQKCGKSISVADPMIEGSLPDGSRVHATLGTDIARRGSNFTIRKFTKTPLTPIHMLEYGTLDSTQLAYLWLAIENRKSMLISGGTASGKTSLLNALSLFIRPSMKIVSIEDTPELSLPHPHWVPEVARTPISEGKKSGEVSLFDLLKSSLRQRPDYIIVGEVRGTEAYVLFQQIATGHAGIATIHAANLQQLIDRLTTPPINLPSSLIQNLDIIVFIMQVKSRDRYVRRVNQILEVTGVKGDKPMTSEVFKWKPIDDKFELSERSTMLEHIARSLGLTEVTLKEEMRTRKSILEWMWEKRMFDYREVSKIITGYYSNPERIIGLVEGI
ncbi:MAG: type II/IV secretion system ATPase subunit [Candidatus Aenigmarchaeota archaeon]|nr:type II/IV secretion system ATPase subunit [Candidatus Aenigmarchaeota archaeon]